MGEVARKTLVVVLCGLIVAGVWLSGCRKEGGEQKWSPHYRKAVEAYRGGEYAKAVGLFEKALLYDGSKAEIYLDIAAIYDDFLGDVSKAIFYYEKYLRAAGDGKKGDWVRGLVREARERLRAAEEALAEERLKAEGVSED